MLSSLPGYPQNLNSWKLFFTPQWVEWGTVTVKHKNTSKWLCRAKTWTYWNKDQSTNHWTTESPKLHFSVCITEKFTNSITTWCVTALPRNFVVQFIINCNPSFDLKFLSALVYQLIQLTVVIHFLFCALSIFAIQYTNFKLIRHLKANKQDFIGWHKFNTVYKILYMYITTNKIA